MLTATQSQKLVRNLGLLVQKAPLKYAHEVGGGAVVADTVQEVIVVYSIHYGHSHFGSDASEGWQDKRQQRQGELETKGR